MNTIFFLVDVVPRKYHHSLARIKTLFNMFVILLDDVAEKKEKIKLLNELLKIPFHEKYIEVKNLSKQERNYLEFSRKVWHRIKKTIKKYPRYQEIKNIFEFDVFQFLNSVKYSFFITEDPYRMNEFEYWVYIPYTMQIIIDTDLDLMCATKFNLEEIGRFREVALLAQQMGRIGNWLTTWEREVRQDDFTSIIFPYVVKKNIISIKELQEQDKEITIEKIYKSDAEKYFLKKWEEYYEKIYQMGGTIKSINIHNFLKKFEQLIFMHLISRGLK